MEGGSIGRGGTRAVEGKCGLAFSMTRSRTRNVEFLGNQMCDVIIEGYRLTKCLRCAWRVIIIHHLDDQLAVS